MKRQPVSISRSVRSKASGEFEFENAHLFEECERVLKLPHPNLEFRSDISSAIRLCCVEHTLRAQPEITSAAVYLTVPADAVHFSENGKKAIVEIPIDELLKVASAASEACDDRDLAAFKFLIKLLVITFVKFTGERPKASFSDNYGKSYSKFLKLVDKVLPEAVAVAAKTGVPLRQPVSASARAQYIKRMIKKRSWLIDHHLRNVSHPSGGHT